MDGYDSLQLLERCRARDQLNPDLLIVTSGSTTSEKSVSQPTMPILAHCVARVMERMRREQSTADPGDDAKHYSLLFRLPSWVMSNAQHGAAIGTTVTGYPEAADYFEKTSEHRRIARTHGMS